MEFKELSKEAIEYYYSRNFGVKEIAKVFSITTGKVNWFIEKNNIDIHNIKVLFIECIGCNQFKESNLFGFEYLGKDGKLKQRNCGYYCVDCYFIKRNEYDKNRWDEYKKKNNIPDAPPAAPRRSLKHLTIEEKKKDKKEQRRKRYAERNKHKQKVEKVFIKDEDIPIGVDKEKYRKSMRMKRYRARKKEKGDIHFKLKNNVSTSIYRYLIGEAKYSSKFKYLPYTIEELKLHLESQFEDWMSWR